MRCLLYVTIIVWLVACVITPIMAMAAPSDVVRITATGTGETPVTGFTVEQFDSFIDEDELEWIGVIGEWATPEGVDGVVVVRNMEGYPGDVDDGDMVYTGLGETFTEYVDVTGYDAVYYAIWAYTGDAYSAPVFGLLEVDMRAFIEPSWIYMLMAIILLVLSYKVFQSYYCRILAGFATIGVGVFQVSEAGDEWGYFIIGFAFAAIGLYVLIMVAYDMVRGAQYE